MNFTIDRNQAELLLHALWGGENVTAFIGVKAPNGFQNKPARTVNEALDVAASEVAKGHDVYMSCAQFNNATSRKADNAAVANGFWLDLDCGTEKAKRGTGYQTKSDALKALRAFCEATEINFPNWLVDSGNGLHAYWLDDNAIGADEWKATAQKLKALTHHHSLLADDSRTADMASVLRLPGTYNLKDPANPKPVQLKRASGAKYAQ